MSNEVGRELKVSDLKPPQVVWVFKEGRDVMATLWAVQVSDGWVEFYSGISKMSFIGIRIGPELEQITDNTRAPMKIYEYLGKV